MTLVSTNGSSPVHQGLGPRPLEQLRARAHCTHGQLLQAERWRSGDKNAMGPHLYPLHRRPDVGDMGNIPTVTAVLTAARGHGALVMCWSVVNIQQSWSI